MEEQNRKRPANDSKRSAGDAKSTSGAVKSSANAAAKASASRHQAKRKKNQRTAIVVFSVLLAILVAIIVLIAVAVGMAKDMYDHVYETDIPIVTAPNDDDETFSTPDILTDGSGNNVTVGPDETDDPDVDTLPFVPEVPPVTEADEDEGRETLKVDSGSLADVSKKHPIYQVDQKSSNVINIVLVGRDEGGSYYGRADSAMLLSIDKKKNSVKLISLMRDTYVPIKGHDWNKLGHSMSYGGMGLYINTLNKFYDLDVQRYAKIDFNGVVDLVNKLGGVEVNITEAERQYYKNCYGYDFVVGKNNLNGEQILRHCRNRSLAGTDFERTRRQRDVVIAIYQEVLAMGMTDGLATIEEMLKGGYVRTNIPFNTCMSLAKDVFLQGGLSNLETNQIPFKGMYTAGKAKPAGYTSYMSVLLVDESQRKQNQQKLNDYLYN